MTFPPTTPASAPPTPSLTEAQQSSERPGRTGVNYAYRLAGGHEACLGGGGERAVVPANGPCFHFHHAAPAAKQAAFQLQTNSDRNGIAVAHLAARGVGAKALQETPVGHYIVEQGVEDSSVQHVAVADMRWTGREFGTADLHAVVLFQPETHLQPAGIGGTADKAMIGWIPQIADVFLLC